eukprot:CAMPEP_0181113556 /NCGR_PEP_ID=MMETSP1071-20121207/20411_1 /TAXON_ID=35127 /ORGANISM="Thalassiosira sp., Strain NH16" /LENGTH=303 /DNA_ID=CAMNT_0023197603 /DNA_START=200 /DNA_END=1111 /DNA_ORIENTATION=-
MVDESSFFGHQELEFGTKASSSAPSTRSPTTVFAVDELSGVFRVPDDAIERDAARQGKETRCGGATTIIGGPRRRCLTPAYSLTTDGELSTFSEDTEENDGSDDSDDDHLVFRFPAIRSRRRSSTSTTTPVTSIFRPVSGGTKRRCAFDDDDDEDLRGSSSPGRAAKRSCSAPSLCHANPIGSDGGDDCHDDDDESSSSSSSYPFLSASSSSASPFKRICRSGPPATSSFSSFFADEALSATIGSDRAFVADANTVSIAPAAQYLQHPLSFQRLPAMKLKSSNMFIKNEDANGRFDGIFQKKS